MLDNSENCNSVSNLPEFDNLNVVLLIARFAILSDFPINKGPKSKDYSFYTYTLLKYESGAFKGLDFLTVQKSYFGKVLKDG